MISEDIVLMFHVMHLQKNTKNAKNTEIIGANENNEPRITRIMIIGLKENVH